ncbi:MAG: hypothetical protein U1D67_04750 [Dehalococcoidia bacterium]|nr:hypothetical protein [Dehalococcoidia bacterium]
MKSSGTVDTGMAIQNPALAMLVDTKDPEAVKQAIASLQTERDYVSGFAPKGKGVPKSPPKTEEQKKVVIPKGAETGTYNGERAYKVNGKFFSIKTGLEIK